MLSTAQTIKNHFLPLPPKKKKKINMSVMDTLAKGITTHGSLLLVLFLPFTLQN